jgi:hypothetical protein
MNILLRLRGSFESGENPFALMNEKYTGLQEQLVSIALHVAISRKVQDGPRDPPRDPHVTLRTAVVVCATS